MNLKERTDEELVTAARLGDVEAENILMNRSAPLRSFVFADRL